MEPLFLLILVLVVLALLLIISAIKFIPNNRVGIIEKRFSSRGSVHADRFIALNKEAGYQPELLRGGVHWLMPIQYRVHLSPLVAIPQGQIGYVFARDGEPLPPTQTLASVIPEGKNFQEVDAFLRHGGQRGPQREKLRDVTHSLKLAQFFVFSDAWPSYLPMKNIEEKNFNINSSVIQ